jgi:hypothetical protein
MPIDTILLGIILGVITVNIIANQLNHKKIMANLVDLDASLKAQSDEIAKIAQAGTGLTEAEADTVKAGIDANTAAITAKLTPPPAPAP